MLSMDNQYLFLEARRHNQAMVDADGNISDDDNSSRHQSPARPATPACPATAHIDAEEEELSANYDFSNNSQPPGQNEDNEDNEEFGVQNRISDAEEEDPNNYLDDNDEESEVGGNNLDTNGVRRFSLLKRLVLIHCKLVVKASSTKKTKRKARATSTTPSSSSNKATSRKIAQGQFSPNTGEFAKRAKELFREKAALGEPFPARDADERYKSTVKILTEFAKADKSGIEPPYVDILKKRMFLKNWPPL
jgi:hypothetical protein